MRQMIILLIMVLVQGCGGIETSIKMTMQSTVLLESVELDPWSGMPHGGSGVAVAPNIILTAKHVGVLASNWVVEDSRGNRFEVIQIVLHRTEDAALMILAESVFSPMELGTRDGCYVGQLVYIVGCPYNKRLINSVSVGAISALSREYGGLDPSGENSWDDVLQIDCFVYPGNSGGPVSTVDGVVRGIVSGGLRGTNITFVIPVDELIDEFMPYLER